MSKRSLNGSSCGDGQHHDLETESGSMARGKTAEVGTTRVSANKYHYTKVADRGWVLTHWLIMENHLGRQLTSDESVRFTEPKFKRILAETGECDIDGLVLIRKRTSSLRARKARLEARIAELQAELSSINEELNES
jgi:hypothetical protein